MPTYIEKLQRVVGYFGSSYASDLYKVSESFIDHLYDFIEYLTKLENEAKK